VFDHRTTQGAYFALAAYMFWGFVPIYFKWLSHVSAFEILGQRIIWSILLLLSILAYTGQLHTLRVTKNKLAVLFLSATLLSINWLTFIYAIVNNNIVETTLGYFITPLVSIFLGMVFLNERLRPLQWAAITVSASGIGFQLIYYGAMPWIALLIAFSFGFYGLVRKNLDLHAVGGLTLEALIIAPAALAGITWLYLQGEMKFAHVDLKTDFLLALAGFVTSFPLLCFAAAVARLSLTAIGMFQYIAPSISLLVAIVIYGEPFGIDRIITFCCIWMALVIFSCETYYHHRRLPGTV
jgi:chloramphenicol-sensitive protein RarD|tara:strand:- start:754 stop:1641 length:888 start_codon:yes stop_codon:yes gene_type:complete